MNITFMLSRFLNGGIDTVLLRYLHIIGGTGHKLTLVIGTEYKGLQRFESMIPPTVDVKYLLRDNMLTSIPKKKLSQKISTFQKAVDAVLFAPIRIALQKTRLKKILMQSDVAVDFDCTFYSKLNNANCIKIAFFHFSINHYHRGNTRKLNRLCGKMKVYDKIVMICNKMAEELAQRAPFLSDKVHVIYNPISMSELTQKASEYNVPDEDFIVSIARLEEHQKDFTTLIKAYAHAKQSCSLPKLYIIGEGRDKEYLETLSKEHGLEENVVFLGFIPNPIPWVAKSKVFVLSSKYEGLPTVLIEALALNRIIVSSDCPTGPAEILNNGKCGILVPMGDAKAMSDAIIKALHDNNLRSEIESNIAQHKQTFSTEHCLNKFMELLGENRQTESY